VKILFIGGTGNISTYCVELALAKGHEISLLNRGRQGGTFSRPVTSLVGDRHDLNLLRQVAEEGHYDVVCDFIGFTPEEAEADVVAFAGQAGQFIYISSVAAYQKPPNYYRMDESTPLRNPYWLYAQNKIASEQIFNRAYRERDFPVTIVRPWHTYGHTRVPTATAGAGYTTVDRVRKGLPIVCHGDGQSLWGLTWSGDFAVGFVGLLGKTQAIGEAIHITTDEILTWDQIYRTLTRAAGAKDVELVHIPSDLIAAVYPDMGAGLLGDLRYSQVFDNSKIRRLVPEYRTTVTWAEGVARSIAWFDADPARQVVDEKLNARLDRLIELQRGAIR